MLAQTTCPSLVPSSSSRRLRMLIRSYAAQCFSTLFLANFLVNRPNREFWRFCLYYIELLAFSVKLPIYYIKLSTPVTIEYAGNFVQNASNFTENAGNFIQYVGNFLQNSRSFKFTVAIPLLLFFSPLLLFHVYQKYIYCVVCHIFRCSR